MSVVRVTHSEGLALLELNRPEARHAFNRELIDAVRAALGELSDDPNLRALVICSTPVEGKNPVFASGADIAELLTRTAEDAFAARLQKLLQEIEDFSRPVIAAIDGYALGGGLELALACDLRVATARSVFGLPEVTLGLFPSAGAAARLPRLIGLGATRRLMFTGAKLTATQAHEMGLVDELVESDARAAAMALAAQIAANDAAAVRAAKTVLNAVASGNRAAPLEQLGQASLVDSKERQRRLQAFLDKRPR